MTSTTVQSSGGVVARLGVVARDIKVSHTVFALPFALLATFLAAGGVPPAGVLGLVVLCMVTARTVAMSANRLLDAEIDARNPRTARRAIPSGALSRGFYWGVLLVCAAGFVVAAAGFGWAYGNWWPAMLSVPVLVFLSAYPLLKRFTRLCHYYLGAALAAAPVCAWVAVAGTVGVPAWVMAGAVLTWTAGFDIIYACQDYACDVEQGVFSVPAKVGVAKALWISRATHVVSAALLVGLAGTTPLLGGIYLAGAGVACVLLVAEHAVVRAGDLSKVNMAFFTLNGVISLVVGTLGVIDVVLG